MTTITFRRGAVIIGVLGAVWAGKAPIQAAPPKIAWRTSLQAALKEAKRLKKPVLVNLEATWCDPCRAMDARTFTNAAIVRESRKWVAVKVDIDADPQTARRYGLKTPPTIVFLKPDGKMASKFVGFANAAVMMKQMKQGYAKARPK